MMIINTIEKREAGKGNRISWEVDTAEIAWPGKDLLRWC
jgi:hypothetical protein